MKTLTKDDIHHHEQTIELPDGFSILVETPHDDAGQKPWEDDDGRGIVTDWTTRDKHAGERVLSSDRHSRRYYDFAATMVKARKDGWGLCDEEKAKLAARLGHKPTNREIVAQAVENDFDFIRGWCNDEWTYVGVCVTLRDDNKKEVGADSLWRVESLGDYWKETAAEMANNLIAAHAAELVERAEWEARDTITV